MAAHFKRCEIRPSDQAEFHQLAAHIFRHIFISGMRGNIARRFIGLQITPTLKRTLRLHLRHDKLGTQHDIAPLDPSPIRELFNIENLLPHLDHALDHPIEGSAVKNLLLARRRHAGRMDDPFRISGGAYLFQSEIDTRLQILDAVDSNTKFHDVQGHGSFIYQGRTIPQSLISRTHTTFFTGGYPNALDAATSTGFTVGMDVFVTDATGIIGNAIANRLIAEGQQVIGLTRSDEEATALHRAGGNAFPATLADPATWIERAMACDGIIHAPRALTPETAETERKIVSALRKASAGVISPPRFVYTGSVCLFPEGSPAPLKENTPFDPLPALTFMAETVRSLQTVPTLPVAIIHPAHACSSKAGVIAEMVKAARTQTPFRTRATPDTFWPLVDADDLADLYIRALRDRRFRLSVIGTAVEGIRVGDLAEMVSSTLQLPLEVATIQPEDGVDPRHDAGSLYAASLRVSGAHAHQLLKWTPALPTAEALVASACAEAGPVVHVPQSARQPEVPQASEASAPTETPTQTPGTQDQTEDDVPVS